MTGLALFAFSSWMIFASLETPSVPASLPLPVEPDENSRVDEIYDQESLLFLSLYSLKGDGEVDYITGRTVQGHIRSAYGNPVYYLPEHPIFIGGTTLCGTTLYWMASTATNWSIRKTRILILAATNPVSSTANPVDWFCLLRIATTRP